jgi:flagellar biosynthesis protein
MKTEKKAVALKYDENRDDAPRIIAVGEGYLAEKIIEIAEKENIPLVENTEVVSKLVHLPVGVEIPQELYEAVARIIIFIYKLEQENAQI